MTTQSPTCEICDNYRDDSNYEADRAVVSRGGTCLLGKDQEGFPHAPAPSCFKLAFWQSEFADMIDGTEESEQRAYAAYALKYNDAPSENQEEEEIPFRYDEETSKESTVRYAMKIGNQYVRWITWQASITPNAILDTFDKALLYKESDLEGAQSRNGLPRREALLQTYPTIQFKKVTVTLD